MRRAAIQWGRRGITGRCWWSEVGGRMGGMGRMGRERMLTWVTQNGSLPRQRDPSSAAYQIPPFQPLAQSDVLGRADALGHCSRRAGLKENYPPSACQIEAMKCCQWIWHTLQQQILPGGFAIEPPHLSSNPHSSHTPTSPRRTDHWFPRNSGFQSKHHGPFLKSKRLYIANKTALYPACPSSGPRRIIANMSAFLQSDIPHLSSPKIQR